MTSPKFAHVQAEYQRLHAEWLAKYDVTDDRIIRALAVAAFADRYEMARLPFEQWDDDQRMAIHHFRKKNLNNKQGEVRTEVVLRDPERALDRLCRIRGMYKNKHEVKLDVTIASARAAEESFMGRMASLAASLSSEIVLPGTDAGGETPSTV